MKASIQTQDTENTVKSRIYGKGRGWCFTPIDFSDLGSSEAIRVALFRLNNAGVIRRLVHGLYEFPRKHEKLGLLPPKIESVVKALARRDQIRFLPSGAYAANLLGLTEQVPAKTVFLTEGASKVITLGKIKIVFKRTTPKNMALAERVSGHVFQAIKYLGKENITPEVIARLRKRLTVDDKKKLALDSQAAPAWISKIVREKLAAPKKLLEKKNG